MALRGGQEELVIIATESDWLEDFLEPKSIRINSCNKHLAKVGLQMIIPDAHVQRFLVSRIKLKYLAVQGAKKMQVSIHKFAVEFKEAVQESDNILTAKTCAERFLALREVQEESVIIDTESYWEDFLKPRLIRINSCNKHLAKVGLQMIKSDANILVSQIKLK